MVANTKQVGMHEAQMLQVVERLVAGQTWEEATEPLRAIVEEDAIERNKDFLTDKAAERVAAAAEPAVDLPALRQHFDEQETLEEPAKRRKDRR